jgi:hypothetical protein
VELPPRDIETPAGELEYTVAFGWRIRIGHDRPPQHRPNPGEQLARTEGLREIYPDSAEIRKTPLPIAVEAILLHP